MKMANFAEMAKVTFLIEDGTVIYKQFTKDRKSFVDFLLKMRNMNW